MSGSEPPDRPNDRTQPRAPQRPLPSDLPQIPGITLQYEVARGGMGVVYGGRQDFLDRRVAVKLLSRELGGESFAARFQREAKILAGIKHQNIVSCHMAGTTDDGQSYLVMEFIDGPSLKAWITKNGAVSCAAALRTTRGVAQALAHAHTLGVIHRDVKPENILLETVTSTAIDINFPFTPKLVDLGLARMTEETAGLGLTSPGSVMGTPSTMSPEQFDDPDSVDFRSDIYGLGCALFEMLVGEPAFRSSKLTDIVMAKRADVAPDPCVENPAIPAAVGSLVQSMLATRREDRPSSYKELDEHILAVLKVLGAKGAPTSTMVDLGGATVVSPSRHATRPMPAPTPTPTPPAPTPPPKPAVGEPSGPGLLRTAEMEFLSAGAEVKAGATKQFSSGITPAAEASQPPKKKVGGGAIAAAAAVVVLGGIAWAVFGRGTTDGVKRDGDNGKVVEPKPTPDPVHKPPVITEIRGQQSVDLGREFKLQVVATTPELDGNPLSYSWNYPPQFSGRGQTGKSEVQLRLDDGLPGVPFVISVDVTDAKGRKSTESHTITVGECRERQPMAGCMSSPDWTIAGDRLRWVEIQKSTVVACEAREGVQSMSTALADREYWEWSGLLEANESEGQPYAKVYVRFEFGDQGWAVICTRDSPAGEPWSIEVLTATRSGEQWKYTPLAEPLRQEWIEPPDSPDEYRGWFSVQRRGEEMRFEVGEARLPVAEAGKVERVATKGPVNLPFTGSGEARVTLIVDHGLGRFDLRRR